MAITSRDIELFSSLLDEKLKGVHAKIDAEFTVVNMQLSQIKEQTTKTNGRVSRLEENVTSLEKREIYHYTECPNSEKIESINSELMEYRIFKKYPKIGIGVLAFTCLISIISIWMFVERVGTNTSAIKENTQEIIKSDSLNNFNNIY